MLPSVTFCGESGALRWRLPFLAALAAAPILSGCILGPEKPDPALDVPQTYREAGKQPHAYPAKPDWWNDFRSKEFSALVEEARVANLDIAVAVARIVQADAQAQVAGAPLLPAVDFNGSAQRSRASQTTGSVSSGGGVRKLYTASLSASYEIDFWGKNWAALQAAEEIAVASRFDREVVELSTVATVATAYFQVLGSQDRLRIARENVASATRILELIRQRFSAGTASQLDVAQQETLVATQRASIPPLVQSVRQNMATLAVLVGRPPEGVTIRGGSLNALAIPRVSPGLPSELIAQRPDIREAEANLASANANVESARAAFFPSIQLTGEYGYQSAALKTLFMPQSVFYNAVGSLTQPIFDGFRLKGQYDLQRGLQEEMLQTYRKAVISGFADVDKALVAVQQTAEQERRISEAVRSARRAFELSEERLRAGTIDLTTVLTTEQTLYQQQDARSQARLARLLAIISLYQALGGNWLADKGEAIP